MAALCQALDNRPPSSSDSEISVSCSDLRHRAALLRAIPHYAGLLSRELGRLRSRVDQSITTRLGILFAGKGTTDEPVVDRSVRRIFGELVLGYRILLFAYAFPTYFTVGAGILDRQIVYASRKVCWRGAE